LADLTSDILAAPLLANTAHAKIFKLSEWVVPATQAGLSLPSSAKDKNEWS
jgi:hypothetical protein